MYTGDTDIEDKITQFFSLINYGLILLKFEKMYITIVKYMLVKYYNGNQFISYIICHGKKQNVLEYLG